MNTSIGPIFDRLRGHIWQVYILSFLIISEISSPYLSVKRNTLYFYNPKFFKFTSLGNMT